MKIKIYCVLLVASLMFSCKGNKRKIERDVAKWIGREMVLPENVKMQIGVKDTFCADLFHMKYKVLMYVNSTGCSDCTLNISKWREFSEILCKNKNVGFLIYVYSDDYIGLEHKLVSNNFRFPVLFDVEDRLNKINSLSKDKNFQTFLLDSNNRVILVGNPMNNKNIFDLYLREIEL